MRHNVVLMVTSLLTILFMTIHGAQDIQAGIAPRGMVNMIGLMILVLWMYGTLMLAGRRSGYIIVLLGSLFSTVIPVLHMMGKGIGTNHDVFFIWILLALGVTAMFSVVVSALRLSLAHEVAARDS
jgi:hypothetical protein